MRIFIGVSLPDDVKQAAAAVGSDLRARLQRAAPRVSLRWVDPANLHITLWFIGEVAEPKVDVIKSVLTQPFRTSSFELRLAGVGTFPPSGPLRVLWLGIQSGADGLRDVHAELTPRLAPLGFQPEKRGLSAHLTLARFKDVRGSDRPAVLRALDTADTVVSECTVDAVTLFRSRLSPKGSQYESLLRVPLS
jgi:2'-5' RNA ligase